MTVTGQHIPQPANFKTEDNIVKACWVGSTKCNEYNYPTEPKSKPSL